MALGSHTTTRLLGFSPNSFPAPKCAHSFTDFLRRSGIQSPPQFNCIRFQFPILNSPWSSLNKEIELFKNVHEYSKIYKWLDLTNCKTLYLYNLQSLICYRTSYLYNLQSWKVYNTHTHTHETWPNFLIKGSWIWKSQNLNHKV